MNQYVNEEIENSESFFKLDSYFYPYGECVHFTDNTPSISITLKLLGKICPFFKVHSIRLFHLALVVLLFLSSIYNYKILELLKLNRWLILISSISFPLISPQIFRLSVGHLNMGTSFFIVFSLYYLLRTLYFSGETINVRRKYYLGAFLVFSIAGFTHLYLLFICGYLISVFLLGYFVLHRVGGVWSFKRNVIQTLYAIIPVLLSVGVVLITYSLIDQY